MIHPVLRPFWCAGITLLAVFLLCPWLPSGWFVPFLIAGGVTALIALAVPALRRVRAIPLIAVCCLIGVGSFYASYQQRVAPTVEACGKTVCLRVCVVQSGEAVLLEVESGDLPAGTRLVYRPDPETVLERYDRFESEFVLCSYSSDTPLSSLMRRASGVWLQVQSVDTDRLNETVTAGPAEWTDLFYRVKQRLTAAIGTRLQGDIGAVTDGICFGADEALSTQATADFRACGVSHLFAVSGLHLTVLLYGLLAVLKRVRVPRRVRAVLGALLTLAFMALIGFTPSVVRSGVLCLVVMLGQCLRRRADSRNSLGLALVLLLMADPFAVYDAGLLLSFTATIGLLFWTRPLTAFLLGNREPTRLVKLRKWIASTVAVSLAATAATLPVTVLYFGRISLVSVPANLLTTLPAEGVLIAGWLAALAASLGISVVAEPFLLLCGLFSRYLLWICEKISAFSLATVAIEEDFLLLWMIGTYVVLLIGYRVLSKHSRRILAGVCAAALGVALLGYRGATHDLLRVTTVSDEELAVVLTYHGSTVLVTAPRSRAALYDTQRALQEQGVSRIDALFIIGGTEPAISYLPTELKTYLPADAAVCYDALPVGSPLAGISLDGQRVRLGRSLSAEMVGDQLLLCWDGRQLWFTTDKVTEPPDEGIALFCTGDAVAWLKTDAGMQVLGDTVDTVVWKDQDWYIKGVGNNGVLGTGS